MQDTLIQGIVLYHFYLAGAQDRIRELGVCGQPESSSDSFGAIGLSRCCSYIPISMTVCVVAKQSRPVLIMGRGTGGRQDNIQPL